MDIYVVLQINSCLRLTLPIGVKIYVYTCSDLYNKITIYEMHVIWHWSYVVW
jgi:hypothetical protein